MVPVGTSPRDDYDKVMESAGIGHCVGWCPTCVKRLKPWWRRFMDRAQMADARFGFDISGEEISSSPNKNNAVTHDLIGKEIADIARRAYERGVRDAALKAFQWGDGDDGQELHDRILALLTHEGR